MRSRYLAVAACGGTAFLDMYATQPLLPQLRSAFGASEAAVGLTISALTFGCALAAPLVGALGDRLGRKRVIVSAVFALALVTLFAASAHTLGTLIAWRAVQGIFMPAIFATTLAYVAEEFEPGVAGRAIAAYITGNVVGGFSGRWITALVTERSSWETAFVALAALNVAGGIVIWALLPRSTQRAHAPLAGALAAMGRFLRSPRLLATYVAGASVLFSLVSLFTFATYLLAEPPFRLGTAALGNVFAVYLCGIVATPLGGRVIDRYGYRAGMLAGVGISAAGVALTLVPAVGAIVAGLAAASAGVFIAQAASQGYIGVVARERRSSAAALYLTFYYVGGGLGAVAPAGLWAWGGWPATVALVLVVQAGAAALTWRVWRG